MGTNHLPGANSFLNCKSLRLLVPRFLIWKMELQQYTPQKATVKSETHCYREKTLCFKLQSALQMLAVTVFIKQEPLSYL